MLLGHPLRALALGPVMGESIDGSSKLTSTRRRGRRHRLADWWAANCSATAHSTSRSAVSCGSDGFLMGMHVTEAGEVWVTDALRPMLWHLTAEQVAAGSGTPAAVPLTPEIPHVSSPDNVEGVVALSETRLVVVKFADGTLYRIDLDPQAPQGRTIIPIAGAAVPLGSRMIVDGKRLVIADENGLSVVELSEDASRGTVVTQMRDPSFHDTTAVARVGDRYLVVNTAWNDPPPYTISSVPVLP